MLNQSRESLYQDLRLPVTPGSALRVCPHKFAGNQDAHAWEQGCSPTDRLPSPVPSFQLDEQCSGEAQPGSPAHRRGPIRRYDGFSGKRERDMPIVFVHGVNNRSDDEYRDNEVGSTSSCAKSWHRL